MMLDIYIEAKLGKVDVIAELPEDQKAAIVKLQKWIDGYGAGGGTAPLYFGITGSS